MNPSAEAILANVRDRAGSDGWLASYYYELAPGFASDTCSQQVRFLVKAGMLEYVRGQGSRKSRFKLTEAGRAALPDPDASDSGITINDVWYAKKQYRSFINHVTPVVCLVLECDAEPRWYVSSPPGMSKEESDALIARNWASPTWAALWDGIKDVEKERNGFRRIEANWGAR